MDSLQRTTQQLRSELGRYKKRAHKAEQQLAKVGRVWGSGRAGEMGKGRSRREDRKGGGGENGKEGSRNVHVEHQVANVRRKTSYSLYTQTPTLVGGAEQGLACSA